MKRTVTFGELMMRLNPPDNKRFLQATNFNTSYAGSEASVAVSLSIMNIPVSFVSRLPVNEIGQAALNELRKYGVDTRFIARSEDRMGIFFVEKGASQRPSKVIYDRSFSAFSLAKKQDYDWNRIFENTDWFHVSGITPALGDTIAEIILDACKKAKEKKITVSCDLNYRNKLWTSEKAKVIMEGIMPYVDHCIGNEEDIQKVFGIGTDNLISESETDFEDYYKAIVMEMRKKYSLKSVAITLRESHSAEKNCWSGLFCTDSKVWFSDKYELNIIDRLGGGDSFSAALIYALQNNYDPQKTIDFATAASCLKHSIEFDFNLISIAEVNELLNGKGDGRIQR